VSYRKQDMGEFTLHVPGVHNVLNATAAIAVGIGLDVGVEAIRAALDQFRGVDRRFQVRGRAGGVSVIDDYGHHPTEIRATLAAAKQCGFRKVHAIFQPHRYTRTRDLMEDFTTAFADADSLFVLDIYAASEKPIEGISGEVLARQIEAKSGQSVRYVSSFADAVNSAAAVAQEGDMVLTLGAGSVSQLGPMILEKLKEHAST
jgi:UDP-N-acetylmuramate--alanine ligase